jgi:hypothetical protein
MAVLMLAPEAAFACPVCGTPGTEEAGQAYLTMTLILSGLPLAMIGGVGYWVYRRVAAQDDSAPTEPR